MKPLRLLFWVLLIAALAGLGYVGFIYYMSSLTTDTESKTESRGPATALSKSKPAKRASLDTLDKAIAAEKKKNWDEAEKLYKAVAETRESDLAKSKLAALADIRLAGEAERQGKTQDALLLYKKAQPILADPSILQDRIERLEWTLKYQTLYEQGVAAEKAGRWEEAATLLQNAREIAPRAGIVTTDIMKSIRANRARANELAKEIDGYTWLFAAFEALDDPYASIAACEYYGSKDLFLGLRAEIGARRAKAVESILKRPEQFPRRSVAEDENGVRAHLKDGKVVEGVLISEDKMGLVVRELSSEKPRNRLIARTVLDKLESGDPSVAREINDKLAEQMLQLVARKCEERPAEALALLGRLFHEFPAAPLLKDAPKQRTLILTTSLKAAREHGDSIPKLLASNIEFFQKICPVCGGTGRPPCPVCKGTGTADTVCDHCKGKGVAYCGACGGADRIRRDELDSGPGKTCSTCNGIGAQTCGQCRGDGSLHIVCTKCRQGRRPTCPACRGAGQKPAGRCTPEDIDNLKKALQSQ
ncbi:MAG: hypothetical protein AB1696_24155 [Planctomycetota bacterium]